MPDLDAPTPDRVADDEWLARQCDWDNVRADRTVKRQAFIPSKRPLEISVDRTKYCEFAEKVTDNPKKTLIFLQTLSIRQHLAPVDVHKAEPPRGHANVEAAVDPEIRSLYQTKAELQRDVQLFDQQTLLAEELARLSTPVSPFSEPVG